MTDTRIRGLGEVALRVNDLEAMQAFYEEVVELRLMRRFDHAVFFDIAPGFEGHTQILALFDRSKETGYAGLDASHTTLDHLAFTISRDDFDAVKQRLEALGLTVDERYHEWVSWRSLYVEDPEGNLVEWVCHDPQS